MGLEAVTYISDFVITNPVGATDPKSQGDDHIRNIKKGIKATFPNLTGAMNATQGDLNQLAASNAAAMIADIAQLADPNADRILFWDDSAGAVAALSPDGVNVFITGTSLGLGAALSLTAATFSGTVTANLFSGSGASLTSLPAAQLTGSIADARLSSNVPLKNAYNVHTAGSQFSTVRATASDFSGATGAAAELQFSGGIGYVTSYNRTTSAYQPLALTGSTTDVQTSGVSRLLFNADGTITTPNSLAAEVGFKGVPQNAQAGSYTLVLTDAGKTIYYTGTGGHTFTIPANGSVAFPVGTIVRIRHAGSTSTNVTIAITTDTLYLDGTNFGTSGSRTLASGGVAILEKISSTVWACNGVALS